MQRVAIVRLSAFGDIIHSMSVCAKLKKLGDYHITWIINDSFKDVVLNSPYIDEVVSIKKMKFTSIFSDIFSIKDSFKKLDLEFDYIIDLQGLMKSVLVAKLLKNSRLNKSKLIGFDKNSAREFLASFFYDKTYYIDYDMQILERNKRLVEKALDIKLDNTRDIFLGSKSKQKSSEHSIALIFEASKNNKMIDVNLAKYLLDIIQKYTKEEVDIIYNTHEELAKEIASSSNIAHLAPKMDIDALKAFISDKKLVIGGDTGPTHIAFGYNLQALTLYANERSFHRISLPNSKNLLSKSGVMSDIDKQELEETLKELLLNI